MGNKSPETLHTLTVLPASPEQRENALLVHLSSVHLVKPMQNTPAAAEPLASLHLNSLFVSFRKQHWQRVAHLADTQRRVGAKQARVETATAAALPPTLPATLAVALT